MHGRRLRPLALGALVTVMAAGVALAVAGPATPAHGDGQVALSSVESGVLSDLNAIRLRHGLRPLRPSALLGASAAQHSSEMGAKGYFEHRSVDGTVFWKRIAHWYGAAGYGYWSVGENLLWASPEVDAAGALRLWMASPEHRRNILDPAWREIGISAVHFGSAPGTYGGRPTTIITTDFGVRR